MENAFEHLKAKRRRLAKCNDMNIENIPHVVAACCILHNICEIHGDTFNHNWSIDDTLEQPSSSSTTERSGENSQGSVIRNAIVTHFNN